MWLSLAAVIASGCGGNATDSEQVNSPVQKGTGTLHTFCSGQQIEVWAGSGNPTAGMLVGTIAFYNNGTATLTLNNSLQFAYVPSILHLAIATSLSGIPVNNSGNPVPGQFQYQFPITPVPGQLQYTFNFTPPTGTVYVAAHFGVSIYSGLAGGYYLPTTPVNFSVFAPYPGAPAFFPEIDITNAGALSGTSYMGYCIDPYRVINTGVTYEAMMVSIYDSAALADLALRFPPVPFDYQNFPLVNYLINKYPVGSLITPVSDTTSCTPSGTEQAVTYGDIQKAIWWLLNQNYGDETGALGDWSPERVNALLCDAYANGVGFAPACGQKFLFVLAPTNGKNQAVFSWLTIPCAGTQTAWADGKDGALFPNSSQWGTYFLWNTTCSAP